jgi:bifunctional aspartokinase / homoserine dehydrogenase 1
LVKGISSINDISLINIICNGMVGFKGFSARLFSALSLAEVNVILITQASSEHTITIAVSPSDKEKAMAALLDEFEYEIKLKVIETPIVEENLSIVAVVGSHMHHASGVSGKLFSALGRCGVNISAIAQGSSELNISVVIKKDDLKRSLNAIHDAMFISQYKTIHLYVVGIGSVGKELLLQIQQANERLKTHHHIYLQLAGLSNSKKMLFNQDDGISLNNWQSLLNEYGEEANMNSFIKEMASHNLPNSVFVDNTANASIANLYDQVFEQKVSVVTCNKIACSSTLESYKKLKQMSAKRGLSFLYETNVGAGLPIIQTLQDLVMSGDEVLKVEAVLSGTISYIFNNYKGEAKFSSIVKKAQELGYTEPDPRDDLNGLDFARKALILSREMGLDTEMNMVKLDAMLPPVCFEVNSVDEFYASMQQNEQGLEALKLQAEKENKVLRYIATITPQEVTISLSLVDSSHPFYSLSGSDNIISFTTSRYKNNPLVVKGPGAGVAVTAAGVFADIMKVSAL